MGVGEKGKARVDNVPMMFVFGRTILLWSVRIGYAMNNLTTLQL